MNEDQERIWARMTDADRERVMACPPPLRGAAIEFWESVRRYEARGLADRDDERREVDQDARDELLVAAALAGEHGPEARSAVGACVSEQPPATQRRTFLRAARAAIEAARSSQPAAVARRARRDRGPTAMGDDPTVGRYS